ncbi:MAG: hypothetical protein JWN76_1488 [Chitinophagaceae bacterium]|nr:hypothetical protein [Chitinophagaceae bacterium]
MKKITMALIAVSLFTACKKHSSTTVETDFLPLTTGNNWTYQIAGANSFTLTITNKDTVINGRNYKVATNTAGSNVYQIKNGTDYYRFSAMPGLAPNGIEELYLKEGTVNGAWSNTVAVNVPGMGNINVTLKYSIAETGISKTVLGKTYNDVIHVKLDVSTTVVINLNLGSGDFYYSKGVGMINSFVTITVPGQPPSTQQTDLVNYQLK